MKPAVPPCPPERGISRSKKRIRTALSLGRSGLVAAAFELNLLLPASGAPAGPQPVAGATPEIDLAAIYNDGVRAFTAGDFKTASERY